MAIKTLKIADLVYHTKLQATGRGPETLEGQEHVEDLRKAIRAKQKLPRPKVAEIEDIGSCVWDGHHTVDAFDKEGVKEIECDVSKMTLDEARMKAATEANRGHTALKRSRSTKEWAVKTVLELNPKWSDGKVAKEAGVSDNMVQTIRKANPQLQYDGPREGADGKVRKAKAKKTRDKGVDVQKLFDFKKWHADFGWCVRAIDALESVTEDKANAKKARGATNALAKIVNKWEKQLRERLEREAKAEADEKAAQEEAKKKKDDEAKKPDEKEPSA